MLDSWFILVLMVDQMLPDRWSKKEKTVASPLRFISDNWFRIPQSGQGSEEWKVGATERRILRADQQRACVRDRTAMGNDRVFASWIILRSKCLPRLQYPHSDQTVMNFVRLTW